MFVVGIDGCRGGWVSFKVDLTSLDTSVELIDVPSVLRNKPDDLAILARGCERGNHREMYSFLVSWFSVSSVPRLPASYPAIQLFTSRF